ncbi:MAG: hypothetical protein JWM68_1677, partial [Verrucomicrobiales bacterium]|nr:hypothetical protein [Verrucomicrobiales bacterium]
IKHAPMDIVKNETTPFDVGAELLRDCQVMAKFAFRNGKQVPGEIVETLQTFAAAQTAASLAALDIKKLSLVHDRLTQIVAPASPLTIQLFEEEATKGRVKTFLGPVPLVRQMMGLAAFFLICIVALSLSPDLYSKATNGDMFESSGWPLFLNEAFLICAAGLGATFAALFQVNRYIVTSTYDPKYESCYWIKFALGLIAGFTLSELIDIHATTNPPGVGDLTRPVLAMVGGFSATVVYRILSRLTQTVESLFEGDAKEILAQQQETFKTRMSQQLNQDRLKLAAGLIDLQKLAAAGANGQLKDKLDQVLSDLVPIQLGANVTTPEIPAPLTPITPVTPSNLAPTRN